MVAFPIPKKKDPQYTIQEDDLGVMKNMTQATINLVFGFWFVDLLRGGNEKIRRSTRNLIYHYFIAHFSFLISFFSSTNQQIKINLPAMKSEPI